MSDFLKLVKSNKEIRELQLSDEIINKNLITLVRYVTVVDTTPPTMVTKNISIYDIDNYNADLSIECNNDLVQPVTEKHVTLDCRYDKVPHIFEAKKSTGYSKTQIIFNIKSVNKPINEDETKIIIPVKTKRKWRNRLFKSIFSFLSVISLTLIASWGTFSSEDVEKNLLIYIILIIGALAAPLSNLIFGEE